MFQGTRIIRPRVDAFLFQSADRCSGDQPTADARHEEPKSSLVGNEACDSHRAERDSGDRKLADPVHRCMVSRDQKLRDVSPTSPERWEVDSCGTKDGNMANGGQGIQNFNAHDGPVFYLRLWSGHLLKLLICIHELS